MYIYKTTNNLTGQFYIGQCIYPVEKSKSYLGSGTNLLKAFKEFGRKNFTKEILHAEYKSQSELNSAEVLWMHWFGFPNESLIYNIRFGGNNGKRSEETCRKIGEYSKKRVHSEETKRKIREKLKGRKPWNTGKALSEEHKNKIGKASKGEKNGFYGKTHLEETRVKIKEAVKGKILSEEHKNKIGKASKEAWKKRKQNV